MKDLPTSVLNSRLTLLSDEKCQMIYDAALTIIAEIGMTVPHAVAREILVAAGATVEGEDLVRIPREVVEKARKTVPSMIPVHDRNGELAMQLGGYNSFFGTGSDLMSIYDFETRERRLSVLADTARMAHLCDGLPNIDFIMSSAHPHDIPAYASYLECYRAMVSNTTKPMVMTAASVDDIEVMWKIACELRGGAEELRAKPYFIHYGEPVSPLQHAPEVLDKLLFCADWGIPLIYSPAPIAGATAPITHAGHIVQAVAESLFGVTIHQLRRPGSPLLTGMGPVKLDMSTVQALYNSAEYYTTYLGIVEMAKWMDIPNWGYAGTSDSQCVDANAGVDIAELTLLSMQAGSNLNHDIGYLDFGLTGAGEGVVITDEVDLPEPPHARGHRGQRRDPGARHHRPGRPGRRVPRRQAHQAARARPAVAAHDPQPQHADELGGRRVPGPHREGQSQGPRHHGQPHAGAAVRRHEGQDRRAGRRLRRRRRLTPRPPRRPP